MKWQAHQRQLLCLFATECSQLIEHFADGILAILQNKTTSNLDDVFLMIVERYRDLPSFNPTSDAEVLCLNQLLEGDRTHEPRRAVVECSAGDPGGGLGRVEEVPKQKLATVTAVAGARTAPFLSVQPATATARTFHLCKPCTQQSDGYRYMFKFQFRMPQAKLL